MDKLTCFSTGISKLGSPFNTNTEVNNKENKIYLYGQRMLRTFSFSNVKIKKNYRENNDIIEFTEPETVSPLFVVRDDDCKKYDKQTYRMWKAIMNMNFNFRHFRQRRCIFLIPLGDFPSFLGETNICFPENMTFFKLLRLYIETFFSGFNVNLLPSTDIQSWPITKRIHPVTCQEQFLVSDIQRKLSKILPKQGACILGFTWTDLYPCEQYNFVLGEAKGCFKSAVFCFGRYEPNLYKNGNEPEELTEIDSELTYKLLKV